MPESQLEREVEQGIARINPTTGDAYRTTSWATVDLEPWKRGERVIAPPAYLKRHPDERALIYPGRQHVFFGVSESLKTWGALLACKSVIDAGGNVVFVDLESDEASFVERARLVGVPFASIGHELAYIRPTEPLNGDARTDFWLLELDRRQPALVVLDGVTELYSLQGWDVNKATDAAEFQRTFQFPTTCASICIDHTAKDAGRGVLGSQHKRAGLNGAEYEFISRVRGGRQGRSVAEVRVTKDRHGFIREWANDIVGFLEVAPDGVILSAPTMADVMDPRDDAIAQVEEFLRERPRSSRKTITEGTRLGNDRVGDALHSLEFQNRARNAGTAARHAWVLIDDAS